MKKLLILVLAFHITATAMAADVLSVAVFDFESKDDAVRDLGAKVSTLISAQLSTDPGIITVERAELEKVLGEQELGLSGTVSSETAARVGHLTGAKVLVTGRVFKADESLVVVAKIIGTETSRVYGSMVSGQPKASITTLAADLAGKISETIQQRGDTLVAKVESKEDRLERIKQAIANKTLPTVSVRIPERHIGPPVADPAAQTEFEKFLQECGFKVIGEKSTNQADVEIIGEAFSAFGARKGNLISCKARVEIKAQRRNGDLLVSDRQTSVAVDITEPTAAKTALQTAAQDLAERLVPLLVR